MLAHITILLGCQLAGEAIVLLTDVPLPGPVIGMVLLFAGLVIRGRELGAFGDSARALLSHLSLLFVPAGVGVSVHLALVARDGLAIGAALVISTIVTIAVTALAMVWLDANKR
ncbi:MAG: CidA/LrgA family protein [Alphaproteobacteria bacterium]|nr:CidA/LrgA family protein [Alphaproteobacteria bacterium]TAD91184.1 MAG: CidA/LrgA family protein [Alphaproteobacteria bacterium]